MGLKDFTFEGIIILFFLFVVSGVLTMAWFEAKEFCNNYDLEVVEVNFWDGYAKVHCSDENVYFHYDCYTSERCDKYDKWENCINSEKHRSCHYDYSKKVKN